MSPGKWSIGLAVLAAVGAAPALAGDREDARVAIAAARAKVETNDKAGVNGPAADAQLRARRALEDAQHAYDKHRETRALAAAKEASSLADLALATAQERVADDNRAAAAATPQQ